MLSAISAPLRAFRFQTLLAFLIIVLEIVLLVVYENHRISGDPNLRYERLERLGAETSVSDGIANANSLLLSSDRLRSPSSATWQIDRYEFSHVLPLAATCRMNLYISGLNLTASVADAYADVSMDGISVRKIKFAAGSTDGILGPTVFAPVNVNVLPVMLSPLTSPLSYVLALPPQVCRLDRWDVTIRVAGASWTIDRVGTAVEYVPVRPTVSLSLLPWAVGAVAFVLCLSYALALALVAVERFGGGIALGIASGIMLLAPLTHDEWDSLIWPRFTDLAAFGGGNPVNMWPGTPLWPIGLTLLAPMLRTSYALFDDGGQGLAMTLIKVAMGIAFVANAGLMGKLALPRHRTYATLLALLAPVGLYELAGGYRETFAVTFALAGFVAIRRDRMVLSALFLALAASISESLIALIALPAVLALARPVTRALRVRGAVIALGTAIGTIVAQYAVLAPAGFAGHAISTRVLAYRYGGASWFFVADAYHALPAWVGPNSIAIVIAIFGILAIPLCVVAAQALRGPEAQRSRRIVFAFIGFVAATFLAYRGIDPNDWYVLFAVATAAYVWFERTSPLPLALGALQGLSFYTIVGVTDFVDWRYFMPENHGLFGALGNPVSVSVGIVNCAIFLLYGASIVGRSTWMFGRSSILFAVLFAGDLFASATQTEWADAVLVAAAATLSIDTFRRLIASRRAVLGDGASRTVSASFATIVIGVGSVIAGGDPGATGVAILAFAIAITRGIAAFDVVLAIGGIAFLVSETRFGWVSIVGFVVISLVAVASITRLYEFAGFFREATVEAHVTNSTIS